MSIPDIHIGEIWKYDLQYEDDVEYMLILDRVWDKLDYAGFIVLDLLSGLNETVIWTKQNRNHWQRLA